MFDFGIGTPELLMIAIVALIVVGPKDLPKLLRTIGRYVGKLKDMARDFQGHIEEAAKETGVSDLKDDFDNATQFDLDEDFKKQEAELSKVFETAALEPEESAAKTEQKGPQSAQEKAKNSTKKPAKKAPAKKRAARKPAKKAAKKPASK